MFDSMKCSFDIYYTLIKYLTQFMSYSLYIVYNVAFDFREQTIPLLFLSLHIYVAYTDKSLGFVVITWR